MNLSPNEVLAIAVVYAMLMTGLAGYAAGRLNGRR